MHRDQESTRHGSGSIQTTMAKKTKKLSEKKSFSLTLKIGDQVFSSEGVTPEEAVARFPEPTVISTKGFLTFSSDGKSKEIMLSPFQIKRVAMKVTRPLLIKQFTFGLK